MLRTVSRRNSDLHASIVYQFHNIEILQSLLMSISMWLIVELAAAAVLVPVDDMAIDMVEEDMSILENGSVVQDY